MKEDYAKIYYSGYGQELVFCVALVHGNDFRSTFVCFHHALHLPLKDDLFYINAHPFEFPAL